ncbi:relaxase/mobilization nuclease domain-containing protein [Salmonella enterica subsp. enterica serovar Kotte]|nr:relaxase/mobilization nuclease domain-containing protein [Salmonella enterica subsp. enterica serovar Kotte]
MLIRCQGHNTGAKEYLESGIKNGREHSRDELDKRITLYGDLDLTASIYESIQNNGQDRYLSITLAFKEDNLTVEQLENITNDYREFLMSAYEKDEYNFYAEAHLPKIKSLPDKRDGQPIERKPHIHIIIPKNNLLSGKNLEPVGYPYEKNIKYWEAIQEKINRKYGLESPRNNIRQGHKSYADILSRYKGDEFKGQYKELKEIIYNDVINKNIKSKSEFSKLLNTYGECRVRNEGKNNEYFAVKPHGHSKFINLKGNVFSNEFIEKRNLCPPELTDREIDKRLNEWVNTKSKEIKYIEKAYKGFRDKYSHSDVNTKQLILKSASQRFYSKYRAGENNEPTRSLHATKWKANQQRSVVAVASRTITKSANSVQSVPHGALDGDEKRNQMLLHNDVRVHVGQFEANGRDPGLRRALSTRRRSLTDSSSSGTSGEYISRVRNARFGYSGHGRTGAKPSLSSQTSASHVRPSELQRPGGRIWTATDIERRSRALQPESRPPTAEYATGDTVMSRIANTHSERLQRSQQEPSMQQLKRVDGDHMLDWLQKNYNLDKSQHRSWYSKGELRITAGGRNLSAPDFLTKHMNLSWKEAKQTLLSIHSEQVSGATAQVQSRFKPHWQEFRQFAIAWRDHLRTEQLDSRHRYMSSIRSINQNFKQNKQFIRTDPRLTREEKQQRISVATFEKLKLQAALRKEFISEQLQIRDEKRTPHSDLYQTFIREKGYLKMVNEIKAPDSAAIDDDKRRKGNTISAGGAEPNAENTSLKERLSITRFVSKLRDDRARSTATGEFNKRLEISDFYSRSKGRSGAVHYQEKTTSKTHFIDKGNTIQVRRDAVKSESVGVALELARAKFGATLNVRGSKEFKEQAIQAAIDKNMDVRFTDKAMNIRLDQLKKAAAEANNVAGVTENQKAEHVDSEVKVAEAKYSAEVVEKDGAAGATIGAETATAAAGATTGTETATTAAGATTGTETATAASGATTGAETATTAADEYGTPLNNPDQKAAAMTLLKDVIAREESPGDSDPDYVGKRIEEILEPDIGEDPCDPDYLGRLAEEQYNKNYGMD